jgi:hypothetical protein
MAGTIQETSEFAEGDHVHYLELAGMRRDCGPVWEQMRTAIHHRLERIVARLGGVLRPLTETRFELKFQAFHADGALELAVLAAHEHALKLFGSCDPKGLEIYRVRPSGGDAPAISRVRTEDIVAILLRKGPEIVAAEDTKPGARARGGRAGNPLGIPALPRAGLDIAFQFEPVWDARHEAISSYVCAPRSITPAGRPGEYLLLGDLTSKERATLDFSCLLHGLEHLVMAVEDEKYFLLCLPLSFDTLSSSYTRSNLLKALNGLPPLYRRYLKLMIDDVPLGVTPARLSELTNALRPFGRVMAATAGGCRDYGAFQNIGLHGVVLNLARTPRNDEQLRHDIVYLAAASKDWKFGCGVFGLTDPKTLPLVQAADVRKLHGPAVKPALPAPEHMSRLHKEQLSIQPEGGGEEDWFD